MNFPETEGIKYAGSKLKILPYIFEITKDIKFENVLDGFSGTTRVSQLFAKLGYKVTSNDISIWSKTFATAYLLNKRSPNYYADLIDHLNNLTPVRGWFSEHYGGEDNTKRKKSISTEKTCKKLMQFVRKSIKLI
jgi:adenine-specific DNA-methyltransferase